MQHAVNLLVQLGSLPKSNAATAQLLEKYESAFSEIKTPISDAEAYALVRLFGPDDCFGLAWTLLHSIETAPSWLNEEALAGLSGDWIDLLRERAA